MVPATDDADARDLRDYVVVVRRRKWLIAVVTIGVVAIALAHALTQKSIYRASTEVLLQPRASEQIFQPSQQNGTSDATRVATEIQVMQSQSVRSAVTAALHKSAKVDIAAEGDTDVVVISADNHDPKEAAHIAQTYAETYVKVRRDQTVQDLLDASTQIQQQIDKINGQIADLNKPIADLNDQIARADNPADRALLSAQRDTLQSQAASQITALQSRIATYTAQLDNLQVASNLTQTGGAQIVSAASVPSSPISPNPRRDGIAALFAGLVLGIALAFLREYLDDRIRSKDDVESALGDLPVLTLVPRVEEWRDPDATEIVSIDRPTSPAAEAYRTLRTSVQFVGLERPMRLIQITSPAAAEGKTTTLANLGVALARAGKRVVMVDCDLRRPRIESFFGLPNDIGFTDVVIGESTLAQAVQRVPDIPRLAILPAGPPPPNPSELLTTQRTAEILNTIAAEADFVLVDSPPILPVSDAIILSGVVDATILVVTANETTKRQSQRALEQLSQVSAPVVGAVLNGVPHGDPGYGYGYGYYGYSYGYSQGGSRRKRTLFGLRRRTRSRRSKGPKRPEVLPPDETGESAPENQLTF
jgi:non-specific protein-tyrosine kinase